MTEQPQLTKGTEPVRDTTGARSAPQPEAPATDRAAPAAAEPHGQPQAPASKADGEFPASAGEAGDESQAPAGEDTVVPAGGMAGPAVVPADDMAGPAVAPAGDTAGPAAVTPAPPRDRRVLRAVLRWTAVVAVFAAVGTATAYGISQVDRTHLPGLATAADGRWQYPELTRPPLPAGSPAPFDAANKAGTHYADLRALLLPAPAGATEDKALRGTDGWLPTRTFLAEFEEGESRTGVEGKLAEAGVRHIAARGWTTPDGTRTRVYLLQFNTAEVVSTQVLADLADYNSPSHQLRGAGATVYDDDFPAESGVTNVTRHAYTEIQPYGDEQVRQAYLSAGDVLALVIQSRKGATPAVPFQQTVVLQSQLLT